ncbi:hypothetical protein ABW20_dc0102895 [Dactylellina cionopaga]|nr:hypothetical protein ABW20_dc0102895 [Dactylellina cionopaga]
MIWPGTRYRSTLAFGLLSLAGLLLIFQYLATDLPASALPARESGSDRDLDIVLSYYEEDLDEVKRILKEMRSIFETRNLSIRVHLYTKNEIFDPKYLGHLLDTHDVITMKNEGKEGGAILRYIIDNYTKLPQHTLFTQAIPHQEQKFLKWIDTYFFDGTGALSLDGYLTCGCYPCDDGISGENHIWHRIPEIHALSHGRPCPRDGVLISGKGQMIASRENIKSTKLAVYEMLWDSLVNFTNVERLPDWFKTDTAKDPYFGHTLERSWMILFDCVKPGLARTCSLERQPVSLESCQCIRKGYSGPPLVPSTVSA